MDDPLLTPMTLISQSNLTHNIWLVLWRLLVLKMHVALRNVVINELGTSSSLFNVNRALCITCLIKLFKVGNTHSDRLIIVNRRWCKPVFAWIATLNSEQILLKLIIRLSFSSLSFCVSSIVIYNFDGIIVNDSFHFCHLVSINSFNFCCLFWGWRPIGWIVVCSPDWCLRVHWPKFRLPSFKAGLWFLLIVLMWFNIYCRLVF